MNSTVLYSIILQPFLHPSKRLTKLLISDLFKKRVGLAESPTSAVFGVRFPTPPAYYKDLANILSPFLLRAINIV